MTENLGLVSTWMGENDRKFKSCLYEVPVWDFECHF